eukprot:7783584-Lingulodinium_polyedra.AAC.1
MVRIAALLSWSSFIDWYASKSSCAMLRRLIPSFVPATTPFNSDSRALVEANDCVVEHQWTMASLTLIATPVLDRSPPGAKLASADIL